METKIIHDELSVELKELLNGESVETIKYWAIDKMTKTTDINELLTIAGNLTVFLRTKQKLLNGADILNTINL